MIKIRVDKFILDSGERYCIVINKESGIPLYYPNLYLTTRFRNTGHAVSTIESKAVNLSLFYRFLENNNINIESNISSGLYLSGGDIDHLITYLSRVSDLRKSMNLKSNYVSKRTLSHRLDSIIDYLSWLTEELLQYDLSKCGNYLYKFIKSIKVRKPMYHK
ncbi:site-specific integrase, partial [Pectobacterium betavasculorum]